MGRVKIAIVGKMRSGKDTATDILRDNRPTFRIAIADPIKELVEKFFPETIGGEKPRWHYQQIGEAFRKLNPDVWLNALERNVNNEAFNEFNIIVTDCRYENEAEWLRKNGYYLIKIECPDEIRIKRLLKTEGKFDPAKFYHESELEVDKIQADYTIVNDGFLETFEADVDMVYRDIIRTEKFK
jgi:dephospho-CoA kinase